MLPNDSQISPKDGDDDGKQTKWIEWSLQWQMTLLIKLSLIHTNTAMLLVRRTVRHDILILIPHFHFCTRFGKKEEASTTLSSCVCWTTSKWTWEDSSVIWRRWWKNEDRSSFLVVRDWTWLGNHELFIMLVVNPFFFIALLQCLYSLNKDLAWWYGCCEERI